MSCAGTLEHLGGPPWLQERDTSLCNKLHMHTALGCTHDWFWLQSYSLYVKSILSGSPEIDASCSLVLPVRYFLSRLMMSALLPKSAPYHWKILLMTSFRSEGSTSTSLCTKAAAAEDRPSSRDSGV